MEVILLERIARLGNVGDIVNVKNGYGRNFLIPNQKALRASAENKKVFEARRKEIEAKNAENKSAAEEIAKKLEGFSITLRRQASQEGKLYGSVTIRDIAEALGQADFSIPKSNIIMSAGIKNLGDYPVRLALHADVDVNITASIQRIESDAA